MVKSGRTWSVVSRKVILIVLPLLLILLTTTLPSVSADWKTGIKGGYEFEGNLDDVVGGTSFNGSWNNATGKVGGGIYFDSNKFVNMASNANLSNIKTIAFWTQNLSTNYGTLTFGSVSCDLSLGSMNGGQLQFYNSSESLYGYPYNDTNTWTMIVLVMNGTSEATGNRIYKDNTSLTVTGTDLQGCNLNGNFQLSGEQASGAPYYYCNGCYLDQLYLSSAVWNQSEVNEFYNNGSGINWSGPTVAYSPQINLTTQTPNNITSSSIFNQNVTQVYAYNNASYSNHILQYQLYRTNSDGNDCLRFINGTCLLNNYALQNKTYTTLVNASTQNVTYQLLENEIYPSHANLDYTYFTQAHSAYTLNTDNYYIKSQLENITLNVTTYNLLEIMLNTTTNSKVYACNSTYTSGNVAGNSNCMQIGTVNTTTYNHTHTGDNSKHNIIPFIISGGKINNGITATETMYFLARGNNAGLTQAWYVVNNSRSGATQTSINQGVGWTTQTYSVDFHVHTYTGNEYLNTTAKGLLDGTTHNSTMNNELIDLSIVPPIPPTITNPFDTTQNTRYINITWSEALLAVPTGTLQNYTVQLINSDQISLNTTLKILNNATLFYYWDVYASNLSIGQYYIRVLVNDSFAQSSFDQESINITTNTLIQTSVLRYGNSEIISNYTANATNLNTSQTYSYSTTNSTTFINGIMGHTYQFLIDSEGFAYLLQNYTANNTINQTATFTVYTTNSVWVNIYDEDTAALILEPITTIFTYNGLTSVTYNTTNGTLFVGNLLDGIYTVKPSGVNYTQKSYTLTVSNRSYQTLNTYLSKSTAYSVFTVGDSNTFQPIEGATVNVERLINGSYVTVDSKSTDITGKAQIVYTPLTSYRFTIAKTSYTSKVFILNPVLFTEYTIYLDPISNQYITTPQAGVAVTYYPKTFYNNANGTLTFIFSSSNGKLINYTVNASYPNSIVNASGNISYGGTLTLPINIVNATLNSRINITYTMTTSTGGFTIYSTQLEIMNVSKGSYTLMKVKENDYGMGLFEKAILVMFAVVIIGGFTFMVGGFGMAIAVVIIVQSVSVFLGMLPLWPALVSIFAEIILLFVYGDR
jgi:hypothetical protein